MTVLDLTCLIEAAPGPLDDTLEADQFLCTSCGAVAWEHDGDEDGECLDCAERTALLTGPPLPLPLLLLTRPRPPQCYARRVVGAVVSWI